MRVDSGVEFCCASKVLFVTLGAGDEVYCVGRGAGDEVYCVGRGAG